MLSLFPSLPLWSVIITVCSHGCGGSYRMRIRNVVVKVMRGVV